MKKTNFINCSLKEVDFSEVDLTLSVFQYCDLSNSTFNQTNLNKADFRTSVNYVIDPDNNRIKKAKFSLQGLPGLLAQYDIIVESE